MGVRVFTHAVYVSPAHTDPVVGTLLGKDYYVIEPIGFGGMAVVYLVEHQTLHKRFAAKVLSVELAANLEARARFTQEAHAASQLDHENIVTISDFGVTNDQRPFFVMELLRGQTLDQRLENGPLAIEEIVSIAVPLGRALAHAHAEGVVHRDVKPENIFLVQRSQNRWNVKVVDFGIAKAPINPKLTKMGQTLGSPMFMAPEACRGDDVDHRADIYSFGIVLYLMMCGRVPFSDDSLLKVLQLQVSAPLPKPCEVNPELAPELGAILERALAKDPEDRYQQLDDLLSELESVLPPGADRLLIEAQLGSTKAFRASTAGQSQPIPISRSQPLIPVTLPTISATAPTISTQAVPQHPIAPVPPSRRKLVIALAIAILGVIAVIVVMMMKSDPTPVVADKLDKPDKPDKPDKIDKPVGSAKLDEPDEKPPRVVGPAPAIEPTKGSDTVVAEPPTTKVRLRVATKPVGATVTLDGKPLGKTPLDVELDPKRGSRTLVVSEPGYARLEQVFEGADGGAFELALKRNVVTTTAPRPTNTANTAKPRSGSNSDTKPNLDIRLTR